MATRIIQNEPYYLEAMVTDVNGYGVTGLTVSYTIYKSSTNTIIESGTMNDIGGGVYQKQITLADLGQYRVLYNTPHRYADSIVTLLVVEEITDDLSGITNKLNRILGLCQENYRIFNPKYDRSNNLTEGTIKIYPTAIDCENDTNVLAEYEIIAQYDKIRMTGYKVKRTL